MGWIARLDVWDTIALDRLSENYRGAALEIHCPPVGVINLHGIVAAAAQVPDLLVAHVGDELQRFGILAEKLAAHERAALGFKRLVLAVDALSHELDQHAGLITFQQRVPVGAPKHLDYVPPSAMERGFQLLNDAAIATHRTVEPLQVAVDHENQVVEFLARCQRD